MDGFAAALTMLQDFDIDFVSYFSLACEHFVSQMRLLRRLLSVLRKSGLAPMTAPPILCVRRRHRHLSRHSLNLFSFVVCIV